jgi:hypothetical protein
MVARYRRLRNTLRRSSRDRYRRPMCPAQALPRVAGMTDPEQFDRAELLRRAAALGVAAAGASALGPVAAAAGAGAPRGLAYRGVTYDTGIEIVAGELTRPRWRRAQLERELDAIGDRLRCNAVSITGTVVPRLVETAAAALERGLHVMIQPRRYDRPQEEIVEHLAHVAQEAERLRARHPGRVTLIAGCEHMLFTPGIVPGATFFERIAYLSRGEIDFERLRERLNAFLARAVPAARAQFGGPLTYAAAEGEPVDWTPFDIVGIDYYAFHARRSGHVADLAQYRRPGKPLLICEFGSCTYEGAPRRGGSGYDIVDYDRPRPTLIGKPVRSEATQARHIARMLDLFETQELLGAFVYTFISPDSPSSRTPRYNLDTAAFSVVKVIRERELDPASRYRWKPKQAFHAIARHNRAVARGQRGAWRFSGKRGRPSSGIASHGAA